MKTDRIIFIAIVAFQLIVPTYMIYQNQLAGRLKISVASTGKYVMPYFLSGFMRQHKGVDLAMDVTNKMLVVKSLEQNEVDFSLVSVIPEQLSIDRLQLLQNKLFLVGSTRLGTKKKGKRLKIFEEYPLIYREHANERPSVEVLLKVTSSSLAVKLKAAVGWTPGAGSSSSSQLEKQKKSSNIMLSSLKFIVSVVVKFIFLISI